MLCRTVSNTLGLFSPSFPCIRYQLRFAERDDKGGSGTQGSEVLQHQVKAQMGWSKLWVLAIHEYKVFKAWTCQVPYSLNQIMHLS